MYMKNLFYLFAIIIIASSNFSCNNDDTTSKDSLTISTISVDSFIASPEKWINQEITIKGTVSHVCRHSGKKLFLFDKNPDNPVKINAGGQFSVFEITLEGSDIEVKGKVIEDSRIDEQYLTEWEQEIKNSVADEVVKTCNADGKAVTGQANAENKEVTNADSINDPFAEVKEMRKELEESGKTYIPIYAIDCISLKEIKKQ